MRLEGFYKVKVYEFSKGHPFWTIGEWYDGYWRFSEGDGDEQGSHFTIIEINEEIIIPGRVYV